MFEVIKIDALLNAGETNRLAEHYANQNYTLLLSSMDFISRASSAVERT